MSETFRILGVAGSLRRGSYNRGLLRAAMEMAPPGAEITTFDLRPLPPFDEDVRVAGPPAIVTEFKDRIRAADALLIATPEYNYSVPGVLKNAIDWASRPPDDSPLHSKPIALMGASVGMSGTIRAQLNLRQSFVFTESYCLLKPEVLVAHCAGKFDENSNLTDEATREHIRRMLIALVEWSHKLGVEV